MNNVTYIPFVVLVVFLVLFAIFFRKIDRAKRQLVVAFAAGYLVHALLISIIS